MSAPLHFVIVLLLLSHTTHAKIVLNDVSRAVGLDYSIGPKKTYGGPSIADLDADGYPDLLFTHHDNAFVEIYFNTRNGRFRKVPLSEFNIFDDTHAINAFRYSPSTRAVHFAISRGGAFGRQPAYHKIIRVDRDRTITDVTVNSGMKANSGRGRSTLYLPLSGPGSNQRARTDMLSLNAIGLDKSVPHQVGFRNQNRQPFFQRTTIAGYSRQTNWYAAPVDFDNNGVIDVVSFQKLTFYKVIGNFRMTDVTNAVLPTNVRPVGVVAVVELDFDNDGKWDLYVATTRTGDLFWQPKNIVFRDYLFRNVGGRYVDVTASAGIPQDGQTRGVTAADLDNDGRIDIIVSKYFGRSVVLRNMGNGKFAVSRNIVPPRLRGKAPADGIASVDYDLDGRVDVIISEGDSINPALGGYFRIFRNLSPVGRNHYLLVRVGSSPSGGATSLHAIVRVRVGRTWMQRRVGPNGVSVSISMIETMHFGLGRAAVVDQVLVRWLDGSSRALSQVAADRVLTVGRVA